jgi:ribonuclease P protein component
MLAKSFRIRKPREFAVIRHKNTKLKSKNFQMLIRFINNVDSRDSGRKFPRFGFIVTKKIGNAVVRNKVKRRLREIVRANLGNLKNNFEAIIIPYPQIVPVLFSDLKNEFEALMVSNRLFNTVLLTRVNSQ